MPERRIQAAGWFHQKFGEEVILGFQKKGPVETHP